jgi:hypothetical protein
MPAAGGTRDAVRAGTTALLVRRADSAALATALGALIVDARVRTSMGAAARALILSNFTHSGMAAAMATLYRETLAAHRDAGSDAGREAVVPTARDVGGRNP